MRDLMAKVQAVSEAEGNKPVSRMKVWLGALSHMSPEHFREHFQIEGKGSPAEKAELEFEVSDDIHHPRAQEIVLESVDVWT